MEWALVCESILGEQHWQCGGVGGKQKADIWQNIDRFTWHTWGKDGSGGENDVEDSLEEAKKQVEAALKRQGWI